MVSSLKSVMKTIGMCLPRFRGPHSHGYARRAKKDDTSKKLYLHIFVAERMGLDTSLLIDHKDRNKLNNQRDNLRVATKADNVRNAILRKDNKTGLTGVAWREEIKKYSARITVNGLRLNLGVFDRIEDANAAYLAARKFHFGEFV